MVEEWPANEFERALAKAPRVVVLFEAAWCPHSRILRPDVEAADAESPIPFARADISDTNDARWSIHHIDRTPTLAYFEHGEELERIAAAPRDGIPRDELDAFFETIHALQEPEVPRWLLQRRRRR